MHFDPFYNPNPNNGYNNIELKAQDKYMGKETS